MHSIKAQTFPNLFASTYGTQYKMWSQLFMKRVSSYARDQGYVTGLASDGCFYSEFEVKSKFQQYF
jgi:hypothetical protein